MATDAAWPPFEYMEGENVVGVDVDIAQDIADGLGVDLEVSMSHLIPFLCIWKMVRLIWRLQQSP